MILQAGCIYSKEDAAHFEAQGYEFSPDGNGFTVIGWRGRTLEQLRRGEHKEPQQDEPGLTVSQMIDLLIAFRDQGHGDAEVMLSDREGDYPARGARLESSDLLNSSYQPAVRIE